MTYIYYACYESDKTNYFHSSIGASNTFEGLLELVDDHMGVGEKYNNSGIRIKYESHYSKYPNSNELEGTITYETPDEERVSVYIVDFNQK
jgi:hypothetical protein